MLGKYGMALTLRFSWLVLLTFSLTPLQGAERAKGAKAKQAHHQAKRQREETMLGQFKHEKVFDRGSTRAAVIAKPLERALEALLEPSEELESPLNNVRSLLPAPRLVTGPQGDDDALQDARAKLIDYFNQAGTELILLEAGNVEEGRGFAPERGEDLHKNWVFSLTIPSLSDHIYWIVVAKDSPYKAYVYGFN